MNNPEWDGLQPGRSKLRALAERSRLELPPPRASMPGDARRELARLA